MRRRLLQQLQRAKEYSGRIVLGMICFQKRCSHAMERTSRLTQTKFVYMLCLLHLLMRSTLACRVESMFYLHKVNCSGSSRRYLPQDNISILDLSFTNLTDLEQELYLPHAELIVLSLRNNQLYNITKQAFRQLTNLLVLQLSNNLITSLDSDTFVANKRLDWLDLSNNRLKLVDADHFLVVHSLRRLDLANNQIRSIQPQTFEGLHAIKYLTLAHNELRTVQEQAINKLDELANISLVHNNLLCDCDLARTWQWIRKKGASIEGICSEPSDVRGRFLSSLSDLDCMTEPVSTYVLYGITAILLVITLLVAAFVMRNLCLKRASKRRPAIEIQRPIPVPVGEYIEIVEAKQPSLQDYETVISEGAKERYVTDMSHASYLTPVIVENGPIYVNVRGPPLPLRPQVQQNKDTTEPLAPAPPTPLRVMPRRCSAPLLDGCDFYEVAE